MHSYIHDTRRSLTQPAVRSHATARNGRAASTSLIRGDLEALLDRYRYHLAVPCGAIVLGDGCEVAASAAGDEISFTVEAAAVDAVVAVAAVELVWPLAAVEPIATLVAVELIGASVAVDDVVPAQAAYVVVAAVALECVGTAHPAEYACTVRRHRSWNKEGQQDHPHHQDHHDPSHSFPFPAGDHSPACVPAAV